MAVFAALTVAAAASVSLGCNPVPGIEKLLALSAQRWLIVGEDHGTNEEPQAFSDIVCQASIKRLVTVAVEQAVFAQPAINAFISSDGGHSARDAFLKSPIWSAGFRDGRSSKAILLLFERLRLLYKARRITSVIAIQPEGMDDAASYEQRMATELVNRSPSKSLVVALVGRVHAMRAPISFGGETYMPMAGRLAVLKTQTSDIRAAGGSQWACQSPTDCGPKIVEHDGSPTIHGLTHTSVANAPYNWLFGLDGPTSASAPQVPDR